LLKPAREVDALDPLLLQLDCLVEDFFERFNDSPLGAANAFEFVGAMGGDWAEPACPRPERGVLSPKSKMSSAPETGILLLLAVDHFLDMGRSATNVVGNSIATAVVAKWEGELGAGTKDNAKSPRAI